MALFPQGDLQLLVLVFSPLNIPASYQKQLWLVVFPVNEPGTMT